MKIIKAIKLFGGIRPMAREVGVSPQLIDYWNKKGIPDWRRAQVLAASRRKRLGLSDSDLGASK